MGKIVRCDGIGMIVGAATGYDEMFEKHVKSVRSLGFRGSSDLEDVGSAGHDDPEGGARGYWAVSVSGTLFGRVYVPHDLMLDPNQFKGSPGASSFLKRTLSEDCIPDSIGHLMGGASDITVSSVVIKSMKMVKLDTYEVEVDIQVDGIAQ